MAIAPNVNERKYRNKQFFYIEEHIKNTEIIFRKYLTQILFLIYTHVPVLERGEHVDLR